MTKAHRKGEPLKEQGASRKQEKATTRQSKEGKEQQGYEARDHGRVIERGPEHPNNGTRHKASQRSHDHTTKTQLQGQAIGKGAAPIQVPQQDTALKTTQRGQLLTRELKLRDTSNRNRNSSQSQVLKTG